MSRNSFALLPQLLGAVGYLSFQLRVKLVFELLILLQLLHQAVLGKVFFAQLLYQASLYGKAGILNAFDFLAQRIDKMHHFHHKRRIHAVHGEVRY